MEMRNRTALEPLHEHELRMKYVKHLSSAVYWCTVHLLSRSDRYNTLTDTQNDRPALVPEAIAVHGVHVQIQTTLLQRCNVEGEKAAADNDDDKSSM